MKKFLIFLCASITLFFCDAGHAQTIPTGTPQRIQHPYYQYDGFIEAKGGILLPRRIANFTPKSQALIYDTATGKISVYIGGWKTLQNVAYTADYNDLINRPDLTQYVPISRTINGYSLTSNVTINKVDIGLGNVQNVDVTNANNITSGTLGDARLSANVTLQGNTFNGANQLLQLDAGGKVAYANLPAALMIYKGVWDASSNTPTLADGTGVNGWVYRVHPGGTVNFGSGNITFNSGDYVIYNGSVWQKSGGGDAVTSVNGQQGVVVLTTANISEGGTNYYYTNTRVQTFSDTRYSLLNHEHVYSDIANLSSYTGFDVRYKSISYVPAWSEITGKPSFATVATSGSYSDLSGTPSLGSLAALSSIGNTYITDLAWSKITGAPAFLTTESDPVYLASSWYATTNNASNWNTAYSWGNHAGLYPTYNGTGATGTWGINVSGNAATATNSTQWSSNTYGGGYSSGTLNGFMIYNNSTGNWERVQPATVQSYLNLGSAAYLNANTASSPNTVVQRNSDNEIFVNYVSATSNIASPLASAPVALIGRNTTSDNYYYDFTQSAVRTFLGLGSYAYRSSGLAELSGANFSGAVTATQFNVGTGSFNMSSGDALVDFNGGNFRVRLWNGSSYINAVLTNATTGNSTFYGNVFNAGYYSTSVTSNIQVVLNSSGANYGFIQNNSTGVWALAYGTSLTGLGTSVLTWNSSGNVTVAGSVTGGSGYLSNSISGLQFNAFSGGGNWQIGSDNSTGTGMYIYSSIGGYAFTLSHNGTLTAANSVVSNSFVKGGGTSSQFLKADGSVDGNTYVTSAVTSIAGTTNQIAVSASTGSVTVSLTNNVVLTGTITSSASYETSDRRLKKQLTGTKIIAPIESLEARLYEKDGRVEYGYYAQDALKTLPTAVRMGSDGYYTLSYTQIFVAKISSLEKRVRDLEQLLEKGGIK
jgi:hypothetical protein